MNFQNKRRSRIFAVFLGTYPNQKLSLYIKK